MSFLRRNNGADRVPDRIDQTVDTGQVEPTQASTVDRLDPAVAQRDDIDFQRTHNRIDDELQDSEDPKDPVEPVEFPETRRSVALALREDLGRRAMDGADDDPESDDYAPDVHVPPGLQGAFRALGNAVTTYTGPLDEASRAALSGKTPVYAADILVADSMLHIIRDNAGELPGSTSDTLALTEAANEGGLAEQITRNPSILKTMIDRAAENPTGFGMLITEAAKEVSDRVYTATKYTARFIRYEHEGVGNMNTPGSLLGSLRRNDVERQLDGGYTNDRRDDRRYDLDGPKGVVVFGADYMNTHVPLTLSWKKRHKEGQGMIVAEIRALDLEYRQFHPGELFSPMTFQRFMRAGAVFARVQNYEQNREPDDPRPHEIVNRSIGAFEVPSGVRSERKDIARTPEGWQLWALDETIKCMEASLSEAIHECAMEDDDDIPEVPDYLLQMKALRAALAATLEQSHIGNGTSYAADELVNGLFEGSGYIVNAQHMTPSQSSAAAGLIAGSETRADSYTDTAIRAAAEAIGVTRAVFTVIGREAVAIQEEGKFITNILKVLAARQPDSSASTVAVAGLSHDQLLRLSPSALAGRLDHALSVTSGAGGDQGIQTTPGSAPAEQVDRLLTHIGARSGGAGKRLERDRRRLFARDAIAEELLRNPPGKTVRIAIGQEGRDEAIALAGLLTWQGTGLLTSITFEPGPGEDIPRETLTFFRHLAETRASQSGDPQVTPIQFKVDRQYGDRTTRHLMFPVVGRMLPLSMLEQDVLQQTWQDGATWLSYEPDTSMARSVAKIKAAAEASGAFIVADVHNPHITIDPLTLHKGGKVIIIGALQKGANGEPTVPSPMYDALFRLLAAEAA